jgi:hypothetical protein
VVCRLSVVEQLLELPLQDAPVTLKIWDPFTYSYYFKTVYRNVRICGLADPASPRLLLTLGRMRAAAFSPKAAALPFLATKIQRLAATEHSLGLCRVASIFLMKHKARQ